MRFATRVFLATSAVSASAVLAAGTLAYFSSESLHRRQYRELYHGQLEATARDFRALELAYDKVSANAARVVRERLRVGRGRLSREELARLAGELGVRQIWIASSSGQVTAASDGRLGMNVFSYCSAYRGLLTGAITEQQTPLLVDRESGEVGRYTMIASYDRRQLIDVGVSFSELGKMLQELADDESDFDQVSLIDPAGQTLGQATNKRLGPEGLRAGEGAEFRAQVPAAKAECCECQQRGFDKDGYGYTLVARASLKALHWGIAELRLRLAAMLALVLAFGLVVSFWASRKLSAKVLGLRRAIDDIMVSRDFSRDLPVAAGGAADEIDALAGHFNALSGQMREAQHAEARAAIAAQVAHDIRSPLTAMVLALNQLQNTLARHEAARGAVAEMLSALSNGLSRVGGIVNRLSGRKTARETAGDAVEPPRLTLVDKLLFDVAQEHALKLPRTLRFSIRGFEPVPGVWAVAQVTELQAALSNILNNACEAVGSAGQVELSCALEGRSLRVRVSDNGVGIAPENLARVFDREFTSGKKGGSGLGLFQAKKAIEWGGGKITLESKPGSGTTVEFTVPVEKAPAGVTDELGIEPGQTLVVADDDPGVLAAWRKKAGEAGVPIREFASIGELEAALPGLGDATRLRFVLDQYAGDGRDGVTGMQFIEAHALEARACLSTSEFDDPSIQARVRKARCQLLPKPRLAAARIVLRS